MVILRMFSEAGKRKIEERAKKRANKNKWLSDLAKEHPELSSPPSEWHAYEISDKREASRNKLYEKARKLEEKGNSQAAKKLYRKANNLRISFMELPELMDPELMEAGKVAKLRDIRNSLSVQEAEQKRHLGEVAKEASKNKALRDALSSPRNMERLGIQSLTEKVIAKTGKGLKSALK